MKIQVLGAGCPKCKKLLENVKAALAQTGKDAEVEKVTDINEIMQFGVMMTPALVVDGAVKCVGKVSTAEEIAGFIEQD